MVSWNAQKYEKVKQGTIGVVYVCVSLLSGFNFNCVGSVALNPCT